LGDVDNKKDYFPLSVEYQERLYAGGRIKGSRWVKREGRATDAEVLSGRLIDRSIRPLFPKSFKNEVQVIITVLSTDTENDADVLAVNAVSAAIAISPIPWDGPIASSRVGLADGELVVNPKNGNKNGVELDLVVSSTNELIDMIEAGAKQVPEETMIKALKIGFAENQKVISLINDLVSEVGEDKISVTPKSYSSDLVTRVHQAAKESIDAAVTSVKGQSILEREYAYEVARENIALGFEDKERAEAKEIIDSLFFKEFRKNILSTKTRADGRKEDELRPLQLEVGLIPRVHGSAMFQRGETQALTITTLGAPSQYQSLESAEGEEQKRYMHHYNFPPFSTGETGKVGQPGRREIGHGALAERALAPVIPDEADFPYAIRVVSEILSSNGSTSMASTCGSTLSLMDAGVPLKAPVAGISTGLITPEGYPNKKDGYLLLTDINGGEDHYGDMDFKIAGTKDGVTAIQLDVKVPGLTMEICEETFVRARKTRLYILDRISEVIASPRDHISPFAPQITTTTIPVDKIGELIGPGGKNIKKLMADTETVIDVRDDGSVFISGASPEGVSSAVSWISALGKEVEPGEIYEGTVARIQPFGAFVNILPGKDGLVHVSQMGQGFVSDPSQVVSEGQHVRVWVTEIDSQGRINLSMLFDDSGAPLVKAREERPRQDRPMGPRDHFSAPIPRRSSRSPRDDHRRRYDR
jgi:polyribonucleotide nucleotidyltransferase